MGPEEELEAALMVERYGLKEMSARILAGRSVRAGEAQDFMNPTLKAMMPDPSSLIDVDVAAERLARAVTNSEIVAVLGDYDVDGATSVALLTNWLRALGLQPVIHIPDRIAEGYGPNVNAIKDLSDKKANLLITVDCGSTSPAVFHQTSHLGMDVIVIDHHQCSPNLPEVLALVNPHRNDDVSRCEYLCSVGLVLLVLVATNRVLRQRGGFSSIREPDLLQWMDLVALGTVADVVPLVALNRAYVASGLRLANHPARNPGISALAAISKVCGPIDTNQLGFALAPRINAGGRLGNSFLGAQLLISKCRYETSLLAEQLDQLNKKRQEIEAETLAEAEAQARLEADSKTMVLVVASEKWHPGVMGLVAARLKEMYRCPVFAIAFDADGLGVGSGRSIRGVDMGKAVKAAVSEGLLIRGGGHAMATGISIQSHQVCAFRSFMEEELSLSVEEARIYDHLPVDGIITSRGADLQFAQLIMSMGPYGLGYPEPVFVFPSHRISFAEAFGSNHLRARLENDDGFSIGGVAFRAANSELGKIILQARGTKMHIAGSVSVNYWNGSQRPQLRLLDAAIPGKAGDSPRMFGLD